MKTENGLEYSYVAKFHLVLLLTVPPQYWGQTSQQTDTTALGAFIYTL